MQVRNRWHRLQNLAADAELLGGAAASGAARTQGAGGGVQRAGAAQRGGVLGNGAQRAHLRILVVACEARDAASWSAVARPTFCATASTFALTVSSLPSLMTVTQSARVRLVTPQNPSLARLSHSDTQSGEGIVLEFSKLALRRAGTTTYPTVSCLPSPWAVIR